VVACMARHDPMAHAARRIWAQKRIERGAYHAPNFMHSVHLDLACKLQQYNLYVAAMIDGDSRMCLALRAIRTKIPFVIYMTVFLPCVRRLLDASRTKQTISGNCLCRYSASGVCINVASVASHGIVATRHLRRFHRS
jgi:hypothetical protein